VEKARQPSVDPNSSEVVSARKNRFIQVNVAHIISFLILFALWIIFSGRLDAFHLTLGLISSGIVAAVSGELMFTTSDTAGILLSWLRLGKYIPWLIYQVFLANLHVMYLVFHPRMMELINPQIIEFESRLKGDYARTTFANSITLTPGTITVNVTVLGLYSVHCIDDRSGQGLPGEMETKIAAVFRE
jgi:multicomponent Na+:H+ antiporter subunit E